MINRSVLVGRLTKDPELRYTPSGIAMVRFTLAVNRTFSNQQGDREADFVNCIAWRKQAESVANFLKKGSLTGVEGRIQTGSYEGQDGKRVYTTDVIADNVHFLEPKSTTDSRARDNYQQSQEPPSYEQNQSNNSQQYYSQNNDGNFSNDNGPVEVKDDDLPF